MFCGVIRINLNRELVVLIDGIPVGEECRMRLRGEVTLSLYPDLITLTIWNLSEEGYHMIRNGGKITVACGGSILASGVVQAVSREVMPDGLRTIIGFSLGMDLWESSVSLAVPAGASVSGTVKKLLEASGTGWKLLSFPGADPVFPRGQAFFGRTAEMIGNVLTAAKVRACLVPAGLVIVPEQPAGAEALLSESDLMDLPFYTVDCFVLSTKMAGWPIGRQIRLKYGCEFTDGIILRQRFDADTWYGEWKTEIMAEVLNE